MQILWFMEHISVTKIHAVNTFIHVTNVLPFYDSEYKNPYFVKANDTTEMGIIHVKRF